MNFLFANLIYECVTAHVQGFLYVVLHKVHESIELLYKLKLCKRYVS